MRELSVVGPAPTPSSVCTHCLSGSCDQHRGHNEVRTLLNSPGQELLRDAISMYHRRIPQTVNACKERQVPVTHSPHVNVDIILRNSSREGGGVARNKTGAYEECRNKIFKVIYILYYRYL